MKKENSKLMEIEGYNTCMKEKESEKDGNKEK